MHKTIAGLLPTEFPNLTELREAIAAETAQGGAGKPSPEVAAEYADRLIATLSVKWEGGVEPLAPARRLGRCCQSGAALRLHYHCCPQYVVCKARHRHKVLTVSSQSRNLRVVQGKRGASPLDRSIGRGRGSRRTRQTDCQEGVRGGGRREESRRCLIAYERIFVSGNAGRRLTFEIEARRAAGAERHTGIEGEKDENRAALHAVGRVAL